jgi:hypothetical protein
VIDPVEVYTLFPQMISALSLFRCAQAAQLRRVHCAGGPSHARRGAARRGAARRGAAARRC